MFKKWFGFGKEQEPIKEIEAEQEEIIHGIEELMEAEEELEADEKQEEEISDSKMVEPETVEPEDDSQEAVAHEIESLAVDSVDEQSYASIDELSRAEEEEEEEEEEQQKPSFFGRLMQGLSKTSSAITDKLDRLFNTYGEIDDDMFEELEEILITSDMGMQTTMEVIDNLKAELNKRKINDASKVKEVLKDVLIQMLESHNQSPLIEESPMLILVIGVNGAGKTTSIGKIAHRYKSKGKRVMLAAGDTFRAAAIDQLKVWGERAGIGVISHQEGSDPAAVIFDAIQAAKSRNIDVLICDTAGRLHNKKNLMNELAKVYKVIEREYPEAAKETLLVLDATTGQNAVQQAKTFSEISDVTGIVLTKLDGTAKGGVVLAINSELNIPVKLIGVGEGMHDLQDFDAERFVKALLKMGDIKE